LNICSPAFYKLRDGPLSAGPTSEGVVLPGTGLDFDVVVIGGGHAGCEAFAAACRVGARTALVTPDLAQIAVQPCNPAVGGPGKGHLVREVTALGGLMGRATDRSGLQFRTLNRRKGPAVRATRVQTDSAVYSREMTAALKGVPGGTIVTDLALGLIWQKHDGRRAVRGARLARGGDLSARAVVVTTGTFLRGLMFVGDSVTPGGRRGAGPAVELAESLDAAGLPLIRLKTGTCPRLFGDSLETDGLEPQPGEEPPPFFDPSTETFGLPQRECFLTYTGEACHEVIRRNLERSALFGGAITGIGPRYCPSIETKIARFPDKGRHQVFLEPEDADGSIVYPSGLSTSLPAEVQESLVHAIPGLERARIARFGYAVEYDAVQPRCLSPSLEVDGFDGLFLAGQILGTSGYEEAAAAGLIAGANAALAVRGDRPLVLRRDQAYVGVMIDDLTTRGVDEPYRMFTSRAEYRLLLREDNADERLSAAGARVGLVDADRAGEVARRSERGLEARERLATEVLTPSTGSNARLRELGIAELRKPTALSIILRRDGVRAVDLIPLAPWLDELSPAALTRLEVAVKYDGYLEQQRSRAERLRQAEQVRIPRGVAYERIPGLRSEAVEKLAAVQPVTLGQASRIPGITPAALEVLRVYCDHKRRSPA
jgi:tRNA uridine 5-carboxymethylaminomethyl modification enzyme